MKGDTDRLYANPRHEVEPFIFDEGVARVFDDMIGRSVPGYLTTLGMIRILAAHYATEGSIVYDLGCSLGAGCCMAADAPGDRHFAVVGVDSSQAMIDRARERTGTLSLPRRISYQVGDIREASLDRASLVILNFTLQFIPVPDRLSLLSRIAGAMPGGGALILSEKVRFHDAGQDDTLYALHHEFKRANGYSELEIGQKRAALENTLIPESLETHHSRLADAGFRNSFTWFQCFNFSSIIAFS